MAGLKKRGWVPGKCENYVQEIADTVLREGVDYTDGEIHRLIDLNRAIHETDCINLNPATNVLNPKAEAALSSGLGSRPSLGYPGDKYEMGLEGIEQIEIITAELAAEVFSAKYAEIRVASGAMANLYAFMATTKPGDVIVVPSPEIGGHVTHHNPGAAGLYGLDIHVSGVDASRYSVDLDALRKQVKKLKPKLITIGGSLNLQEHPVREIRSIADEVGAWVLFDAAHLSGMFAGGAWKNPLDEGAHLMTMSTYKSLGGPASGLIVTNSEKLAKRLDAIAFPGLTANFDAAKSAALAITLLDWKVHGKAYAQAMVETACALASHLHHLGAPVFGGNSGFTTSHQFALEAASFGGGQAASKKLREADILACGIGLPIKAVKGDMNGLRFGTPEIVRWGMGVDDMEELARLLCRVLVNKENTASVAPDVKTFRRKFTELHYIR